MLDGRRRASAPLATWPMRPLAQCDLLLASGRLPRRTQRQAAIERACSSPLPRWTQGVHGRARFGRWSSADERRRAGASLLFCKATAAPVVKGRHQWSVSANDSRTRWVDCTEGCMEPAPLLADCAGAAKLCQAGREGWTINLQDPAKQQHRVVLGAKAEGLTGVKRSSTRCSSQFAATSTLSNPVGPSTAAEEPRRHDWK
jgi:hypothetical protein